MSNVTEFPTPDAPPPLLVGPFTYYQVVVNGKSIPRLTGRANDDGSVDLVVDRRFSATFPTEDIAHQAASLIAHAMAIGEGYSSMNADTKDKPFAPGCIGI